MPSLNTYVLDEIQSRFQLDPEWMTRSDKQISWVAHNLEQSIEVSGPFESHGIDVVVVKSTVPVVQDVRADEEKVCALLAIENRTAIGSAYVYDKDKREIFSSCKLVIHDENFNWRCIHLQTFIITQLILAENTAEGLAEIVGGKVAAAPKTRTEPDDMLGAMDAYTLPLHQIASRFSVLEEFEQASDFCNQVGGFSAGGDETGTSLEFRFTDEQTALGQLRSDVEHPAIGKGLLSLLRMPMSLSDLRRAAIEANEMNLEEARFSKAINFTGAWTVNESGDRWDLAFSSFMPNVHFSRGLITDACMALGIRVRHWEEVMYPDREFTKSAVEIAETRFSTVESMSAVKH